MAQVKLGLSGLSVEKKIAAGEASETKLTGKAAYATELTALTAATEALKAAQTARANAESSLRAAVSAEADAEKAFDKAYADLGGEVQQVTKGDETAIKEAGFQIAEVSNVPTEMPPVEGLGATFGDDPGEVDLGWNPVRNRRLYEVQWTADPAATTGWEPAGMPTKSKLTVPELASGTRPWFRVRAIGASGPGPWSSATQQLVP